ncbi:geranylgeranyl reductase family protein [Candidatus Micrarchaeota archaeon]|nr:geranylgeranyl reductase family protein [Candidatus Micrarchaeota archaeon]
MDFDHDVIVIGGGPAGSTFARYAAAEGMDVLVVDKRKEIGVPVRCGEGLGESEIITGEVDLPGRCFSTNVRGARIYAPNGKSLTWKTDGTQGWVLERKIFDKWLCELAVEKGARVKVYTRATGLLKENGSINGVMLSESGKGEYPARAPLVVSAEGMESMIAREAGFNTVHRLQDVGTCYQYEMKPIEHENLIELYFGKQVAPRGYVWIFPKAGRKANVGVGIGGHLTDWKKRSGIDGAAPKEVLDRFIEKRKGFSDANILTEFGGVISVGAPMKEFVTDNFMVIGTAAKQVDPIHGGGIYLAMHAGRLAAGIAAKAHETKDYSKKTLYEYEKLWRESEGKTCEQRLKLQKALEKLDDEDLDYIIGAVTYKDLELAMSGKFAEPVAKIVAGRPRLLKVLGALR